MKPEESNNALLSPVQEKRRPGRPRKNATTTTATVTKTTKATAQSKVAKKAAPKKTTRARAVK